MKTPVPHALSEFLNYNPFHNIIHYYVDLSTFLITSGDETVLPKLWWALNRRKRVTSLYSLEVQYKGPQVRDRFVGQAFKQVQKTKKTVCAERLGFKDLFVPVLSKGTLMGYLQAGAFADKAITLDQLTRCWKELSGKDFSPDLPEFRSFTYAFLEIPVLDGPVFLAFQEALELFAKLLSGEGKEDAIGQRLSQLQNEVFSKRLPHSYWLDWALGRPTSESVPAWSRGIELWSWTRNEIGLTRVPTTVLTVIPRKTGKTTLNWAEETLRAYHFQRQCFLFGRTLPETVGGKLDDYGAVFVTAADPKLPRLAQKKHVEGIAQKIRAFAAKELGGPVLVGVGETVLPGEPLNPSYRQAVLALHLWKGSEQDIVFYGGGKEGLSSGGFASLRPSLDGLNEAFSTASFSDLQPLKDQFLRQAIQSSFQNPQEIRWHFHYALDRLSETVGVRLDLGRKESRLLRESVAKILENAVTFQEIVLAYQETISKLEKEIEKPFSAERDHSIEKAREFLDRHFKESLPITRLSKMAGVSVSTFSRRFKKLTGLGLEAYLQKRRLDEAKRLLKATRLPVFRIAKDCGFKSNPYFIQLFKSKNGLSPQKFRKSL